MTWNLFKTVTTAMSAAATISAALVLPAMAQGYPDRPISMVVAYPPGQGTDLAARYFAEELGKALGQPVVVDNRPGAGGNIGTAFAARAVADGYTIIMGTNGSHAVNPFMYQDVGYDALSDFEPVAATVVIPMAISANDQLGVKGMADLVEAAKARPGEIDVALPSVTAQLVFELLKAEGVALNGIRFKGSADAQAAVMGNQVPVLIDTLSSSSRQFGRLVPIAVSTPNAVESYPEVKSISEQALDGFSVVAWNALYTIKGTPPEVRDRLEAEMKTILAKPETRSVMQDLGFELPPAMERAELEDWAKAEFDKFGTVIQAAGLKAE